MDIEKDRMNAGPQTADRRPQTTDHRPKARSDECEIQGASKVKKLPEFLRKYFWDVDFKKMDMSSSRVFVLRRLIEYGDKRAAAWMKRFFSRDEITEFLSYARIDPRSGNFWAVVFDIERKKVLCIQKHYLEIRKRHWPY